jgi:poly(glycerol-phosphate) alpha-glucosyltransferase
MLKSAHLTGPVSRQAGGLFDALLRLVQSEHRQGVDVKVFGLWDEQTAADLPAWQPVPVAAFQPAWPKVLGRAPRFSEALLAFAPDLSHTHGLWRYSSIAARNYSRATRRPYLVSPHGMLDPWALQQSRWKKRLACRLFEREHLRGARCLRALCVSEAQSIRRLKLANDIALIPNGIDLPEESIPAPPPPWLDALEPGKQVLLFLGRIHPKKGLVNLLQAWAKNLQSANGHPASSEWVLAVAGWDQGGHEEQLKRLAAELGLAWTDLRTQYSANSAPPGGTSPRRAASVMFLGPQFADAKAACYRHCDAVILPSFSEGLPMVVLESWAHSKPVLMTPECNLPEGFAAGAALQVDTTAASLAAGLDELRHMTAADRLAMGRHGRDLVVERFAWPWVAGELQSVYRWILGGGPKPACILDI